MQKMFFPAVFQKEEVGFSVRFPDLDGCFTQGETMDECYKMAIDALGLTLSYYVDNKIKIPKASGPQDISLVENQFVVVVEFDLLSYLKKTNTKAIKKTLTIPEWLNNAALDHNINFSQVLQDALKAQLHLQ